MPADQTVQNAVFQIELGRGKAVIQWVAAVLVAVALAVWYAASEFRGLDRREAQDMAQLARNISRGEGYTTSVIRPISLWHLTERAGWDVREKTVREQLFQRHPDIANPPLYPTVLAGIFRLAGGKVFQAKPNDQVFAPEQWLIVPFGQLCLLGCLLLVYFWAKQLFDQRIAITAGVLLLFSDTLWSYAISGLPTTLLMLLVVAAAYCLYRADVQLTVNPADRGAVGLIILSGILLGLSYLTRYSALFLLLPFAIYVARIRRGRQAAVWVGIYLVLFLVVVAPWWARNYQVSHSLLGLPRYQIIESEGFLRNFEQNIAGSWSFRSSASRFLVQLRTVWTDLFRNGSPDWAICFFTVGLLYGFRRDETSRLRRILVLAVVLAILGMALIGVAADPLSTSPVNGGNLLVLFLPLLMVYGVAFFYLLLDRIQFQMRLTQFATIGVFAALNVAPILFTLLPPARGPYPYPPYCAPATRMLATWFDQNEIGVSDSPWSVAWYADRRCVWLPQTPEQFVSIHDFVAPHSTQFLFLTPYMLDRRSQSEIVKGEFKPWASIVRGQIPAGFPFRTATPIPPDNDQILFASEARWFQRPLGLNLPAENPKAATPTNAAPAKPAAPAEN